jgi:hypothetical protein
MSILKITDDNVTFDPKAVAAERRNPSPPQVSRRTILRGSAASIALPALDSLLRPSVARAQTKPPIRLVTWHIGCGVWGPSWYPTDFGTTYTLSPSLMPLADIRNKVHVLSGIQNLGISPTGSHGCGPPGMTTCRQGTKPAVGMGISVDQVYAQFLGTTTRIPSLQLTVNDKTFSDVAYPAVYNGTISWADTTTPLPPTVNPQTVFDRLFAGVGATTGTAAAADAAKRLALRTSVLDFVRGEATTLQPRMGVTDRRKLDEYFTSIRSVETELQRLATMPNSCTPGAVTRPTITRAATVANVPALTTIMLDLMALAFQCDATRVISFMQSPGGQSGFTSIPWLNITSDHHTLSHHQSDPVKGAQLASIDQWEVMQYVYFLKKLDAIQEGGATVLDNSVVFLSSEITDGNAHNQVNKPILIGGSAGGKLLTGRHTKFAAPAQANLFIALLNLLGPPVTAFGSMGTMPLAGLTI